MNWDKIKTYERAYSYYKKWFEDSRQPHNFEEDLFRELYDFFDELTIMLCPVNNHARGTNVWNFHLVCEKINMINYIGVFTSRSKAEETGFEMAFKILEINFDLLVKK